MQLPKFLSSSAGRTLFISLTVWLLLFTYCQIHFWRDIHTSFFQSKIAYDFKYTVVRHQQAQDYLRNLKTQNSRVTKASLHPDICVAVVTVKRQGEQYIDAALGSLLQGLNGYERKQLHLMVLFADPDPTIHPSWNQPWLDKAADWTGTYNVSNEVRSQLREWMEQSSQRSFFEKEAFDYTYALSLCHETSAPYILMLEDDIIAADSWLAKTTQSLRQIEKKATEHGDPYFNWFYFRLFWFEPGMQWATDNASWVPHMYFSILLGTFVVSGLLLLSRRYKGRSEKCSKWGAWCIPDGWTIIVLSLVTTPAFVILFFMVGKEGLMPTRGVFPMRWGCCTQAMVYPRDQVPPLVEWIHERDKVSIDVMVERYADEKRLERLAIAPQLMQHVGLSSTRDSKEEELRRIRALQFEDHDAAKLKKDHTKLTSPWLNE